MAAGLRVFAAVMAVAAALSGAMVSAQTHHIVGGDGGWGPASDVSAWLSGRVFRVGDKILFKNTGTEAIVVELQGPEEFVTCNLSNPIKMYTDKESHVPLEKEGVRYFASGDQESCKNGLKFHVSVQSPSSEDWSPPSSENWPPLPYLPPPGDTFGPPEPVDPTPAWWEPPPEHPPSPPSAASYLNGGASVVIAGLLMCYMGVSM